MNESRALTTVESAPMPLVDVEKMAKTVFESKLFAIQSPQAAFTLMLLCQADGLHPIQAMRRYHLIEGKPTMRADAMQAEFQKRGGRVEWSERSAEACAAKFSHPQTGEILVRWTIEEAKKAGLTGKNVWQKHPRQMLSARVISEGIRAILPEVVCGIYTPEESGEMEIAEPAPTIADAVRKKAGKAAAAPVAPPPAAEEPETVTPVPVTAPPVTPPAAPSAPSEPLLFYKCSCGVVHTVRVKPAACSVCKGTTFEQHPSKSAADAAPAPVVLKYFVCRDCGDVGSMSECCSTCGSDGPQDGYADEAEALKAGKIIRDHLGAAQTTEPPAAETEKDDLLAEIAGLRSKHKILQGMFMAAVSAAIGRPEMAVEKWTAEEARKVRDHLLKSKAVAK